MKRIITAALCALLIISSFSCTAGTPEGTGEGVTLTDAFGGSTVIKKDARVVSCYASFAECWELSGGTLVGVTSDALEEGRIKSEPALVGTVKQIDLERLTALSPDYVILSADLTAHTRLDGNLTQLGIAHGYFRVDTFEDYSRLMEQFCAVNGRPDLYEKNVIQTGERIEAVLSMIPRDQKQSVLLIRAYSTGVKAKTDDNLAGQILSELGLLNIADETPSLLEDMSLEHIISRDPDHIFVLTMGSEESARAYLAENIESSPAWSGLTAVKNGNYRILPKDLFHYKPNSRWNESYEYLAKCIYPEIFS